MFSFLRRSTQLLILGLLLVGGAACESPSGDGVANGDAPILSGVGDMPKALVTVWFSPTPDPANLAPTPFPTPVEPTETPEPLEPTLTPTPYVGVFVGPQVSGTPAPSIIPPLVTTPLSGVPGNSAIVGAIPPAPGTTTVPGTCPMAVASSFNNAYLQNPTIAQQLGCPINAGQALNLVYQPFERGKMFWRDSRQIYVLQADGTLITIADAWQEGMPADDPAFQPPPGFLQPIRGFGFAWRNNEPVRNALGWATQPENIVASYWQDFQNGGAMFTGDGGLVYAIMNGRYSGPLSR